MSRPADTPLWRLGAHEIARAVRRGELHAVDVVRAHLERIEATEPATRAWLHRDPDTALQHAAEIDRRRADGQPLGPLAGVPVAIKDNIATRGMPATAGSRMLADWYPPYEATVCARLRAADAVLLGKTNLDEFAMGSSTEHSAFGPTRNPHRTDRVPGGSSGGSAAAVAAGHVPLALGSDTGGSIRQPAAFCGVHGLKPTYGLVSRFGLIAFASSLDQIGPIARSCTDLALALHAIAGHDPRDATSLALPPPPLPDPRDATSLAGLRIGVDPALLERSPVEPAVREAFASALERIEHAGATLHEIALPEPRHAIATYYVLAPAECSSNLARYDGVHFGHRSAHARDVISLYARSRAEGFGAEVKRRILLGTYVLSAGYYEAYYGRALRARRLVHRAFEHAFAR
ncbi:MAG: Asp-tRNA(Asn)/Glu-tRNA(Gln) amidotransferase subunit GatA, partial [Planctomycetota bacterium]